MELPTLRVKEPEQSFKLSCVALLVLSLLTSAAESDVSCSLAVLGLVGATVSNAFLMQTAVWLIPGSIVVDIIRLSVSQHKHSGFFILLDVIEMAVKAVCTYFAYVLWRAIVGFQDMGFPNMPLSADAEGSGVSASRAAGLQFQEYAPPPSSADAHPQQQQGTVSI